MRLRAAGSGVIALAVHPGLVQVRAAGAPRPHTPLLPRRARAALPAAQSALVRHFEGRLKRAVVDAVYTLIAKAPADGAATVLWAALAPGAPAGGYAADCAPSAPSRLGADAALAEEVWAASAEAVGWRGPLLRAAGQAARL